MNLIKNKFILLLSLSWTFLFAQEYNIPSSILNGDSTFDVKFCHIQAKIGIEKKWVDGHVKIVFEAGNEAISEISLHLVENLNAEVAGGNAASISRSGREMKVKLKVIVQPGQSSEVIIAWRGEPKLENETKGLRYETRANGMPIIASLTTPYLAHTWWPCKDGPHDKIDSIRVDITVPATFGPDSRPLKVVSNGLLLETIRKNDSITFCWKHNHPIVPYYVMAAVSDYEVVEQQYKNEKTGSSFPLIYYTFPEKKSSTEEGVKKMPEVMAFFEEAFGPYPYADEKYGMTELGFYSGIENQTNAVMKSLGLDYFDVAVHELSHMWFANSITCKGWEHGWLNEGFANYAEALWAEHTGGQTAYLENVNSLRYYGNDKLYLEKTDDPFKIFVRPLYWKGAWAMHLLRELIGDKDFFSSLYKYSTSPQFRHGHATTSDFQNICESESKMNLHNFFQSWIYQNGNPNVEYFGTHDFVNGVLTIYYEDKSSIDGSLAPWNYRLQWLVLYRDGSDTLLESTIKESASSIRFSITKPVRAIITDPLDRVLMQTMGVSRFDRPADFPVNWLAIDASAFASKLNITANCVKKSSASLGVVDFEGKLVRKIMKPSVMEPGEEEWDWNGKDDKGRVLKAGWYWIELVSGKEKIRQPVMWLGDED